MIKLKNENGSYSLEALIALTSFVLILMLTYSQIKSMIAESIMQHAVSSMSQQVATYVYVLDKAGLVIEHSSDELSKSNEIYVAGEKVVTNVSDIGTTISNGVSNGLDGISAMLETLFSDSDSTKGSAKSMATSFKDFIEKVGTITADDLKTEGTDAARIAGEKLVKNLADAALAEVYNGMLDGYLPSERDNFCRYFNIRKDSISFSKSKVFPTLDNNSVMVVVEYVTYPEYKLGNLGDRTVYRCAYSAAWVKSNQNSGSSGGSSGGAGGSGGGSEEGG